MQLNINIARCQVVVKFYRIYILDIVPGIIAASDESSDWTDIDFFTGLVKIFTGDI